MRSAPNEEQGVNSFVRHEILTNPLQPRVSSLESSLNNRRQYQLQRIPDFRGYGFSVKSDQGGVPAHKISQIAPNSPAAQQGKKEFFLFILSYFLT